MGILTQIIRTITGYTGKHPYPVHMENSRAAAADGMVLLKNNGDALPLKPGKIALFGAGATDTTICGTGSGHVFAPYKVTVLQGLQNAGFSVTSQSWLKRFAKTDKQVNKKDKTIHLFARIFSGEKVLIDELLITAAELAEAEEADTALYVIRRNAGENHDRKAEPGDYYLSKAEQKNLEAVAKAFAHTIVVLNTCVVDANFIYEIPGIDAALLMGAAGNESGNALADVLTGRVCPSGKLTDTWAKHYGDYPASATFSHNDGETLQEDYCEDIFVGYRYFDTFDIEPLFPFGFGLSYTSFETAVLEVAASWQQVQVSAEVKNTGAAAGRDVIQVYVSAPEGRLPKPRQELKGFAKTKLLQPGEAQTLTVAIPTESFASYDTAGAAFVMEKGDYVIRIGSDSRHTTAAAVLRLDGEAVLRTVHNQIRPDRELQLLQPPTRKSENIQAPVVKLKAGDCITINGANKIERKTTTYISEGTQYSAPPIGKNYVLPFATAQETAFVKNCPDATLPDVTAGRVSMEEFVASLEPQVLLRLVTGRANETKHDVPVRMKQKMKPVKAPFSSGQTTALFTASLGIPQCRMTDGPAGLHLLGSAVTGYPTGIVLAQTWDPAYGELVGTGMGRELAYYNHQIILGPGMNIHRDPLCGRNFEYYSEDPLLTGKMGAAVTTGVQSISGCGVSIKHFACNNQEEGRAAGNSTVSERALREIYLRGFEICVREAKPMTVMSSYNKINGVHTSSHYELLTEVLRGEWGFDGLVMTDWGSQSTKVLDLHAGNDLIMSGYRTQPLLAAMNGETPAFAPDGYVEEATHNVFGGFIKETVQHWNCFAVSPGGPDRVSTRVAAGITLNQNIEKMVEAGAAVVEPQPDGSNLVTYYGINRGAYLSLGDVQKCAASVLRLCAVPL